jgi:phage head maturation protease
MMFQILTQWDRPRYPGPALALPSERAASAIADIDAALEADTSQLAADAIACINAALGRVRIEWRSAATETVGVDRAARVIAVIAVPWDSPASVPFRGQTWKETFVRGAFDGIDSSGTGVRVNRDHDRSRTIGKVIHFDPHDTRGLIAEIQIARTALGDESLALAEEDCLSASVAFMVPAGGEQLDHRTRSRRIVRATLDHVALTADPAYEGAAVLSAAG